MTMGVLTHAVFSDRSEHSPPIEAAELGSPLSNVHLIYNPFHAVIHV